MCVLSVKWDVGVCTSVFACMVEMGDPGRGRVVQRCYLGVGTGRAPAEGRPADR